MPARTDPFTRTFLGLEALSRYRSDLFFGFTLHMQGRAPGLAELREHVAGRMALLPFQTCRPSATGGWSPDPRVTVTDHVRSHPALEPGASPAHVLPMADGAQWGLWLLPEAAGQGWAVCYLAHHAFQDATAVLNCLTVLFGEPGAVAGAQWRRMPYHALGAVPRVLATYRSGAADASAGLPPEDGQRRFASAAVPLDQIQGIARRTGTTFNQVHLAAMAGALRGWTQARRPVWACVPVDTRLPGEDSGGFGNHLGLLRVPLPCDDPNPAGRLRATARAFPQGRIARQRRALRALAEGTPGPVADWALRRLGGPTATALTVSATRAGHPLAVLGRPVERMTAVPWLPPGHSCFSLLVSHRDQARVSMLTGSGEADPARFTGLWAEAIAELLDSCA